MTDPYVPMDRKKIQKDTAVAGNVDTILTVPAGERWLLLNVAIKLTTDATVVNRYPALHVRDVADVEKFVSVASAIATSTTTSRFWSRELSTKATDLNALGFQLLDPTEDIALKIASGVVGDAYDYLVEYLKVEI